VPPGPRIGQAIGTLQATQILSTAVGPFVGGMLYALVGIRNAFLVTSVCCVAALALILVLYRDVEGVPGEEGTAGSRAAGRRSDGWR